MRLHGSSAEAVFNDAQTCYHMLEFVASVEGDLQLAFIPANCFRTCMKGCGDDDFRAYARRCIRSGEAFKSCFRSEMPLVDGTSPGAQAASHAGSGAGSAAPHAPRQLLRDMPLLDCAWECK